jgi:O-antigen/teichoic acid export membrane protein
MINFYGYLKNSLLVFVGVVGLGGLMLMLVGGRDDKIGAGIGLIISYANTLIGFAIISWGYKRTFNKFLASIYGGMIFRFLLIFGILFVLIVGFEMPAAALIISLCVSYFVFLGLEIYVIHTHAESNR